MAANRTYTQAEDTMARNLLPAINNLCAILTMNDPTRGPEEVSECAAIANTLNGFLVDLANVVVGTEIQDSTVSRLVYQLTLLDTDLWGAEHVREELKAQIRPDRDQLDALITSIKN